MDKVKLDAYLFFRGNCQEAMEFYKSIFGGELEVQNYDEAMGSSAEMKGKVMHASIKEGEVDLMASDSTTASPTSAKIELSLSGYDEQKLRGFFESLSEGGKVNDPLKEEFWGDIFGRVTDKFGIDWMINIGKEKRQS